MDFWYTYILGMHMYVQIQFHASPFNLAASLELIKNALCNHYKKVPWRRGVVVSVSAFGAEDSGFESPRGYNV
jgi:hypothetical protein